MQSIDWIVLVSFLSLIVLVGLSFARKAGKDLSSFFLGGRNLPWYLLGVSMVATTFAADTPLAVSELVAGKGISGNWLWWNALIGGMLTTFFFAPLWRRSGVLTEVELIELRYSGKEASFLRGFKAIYLGGFMNVLIIGWVNLAMMTILQVFFDLSVADSLFYMACAMGCVAVYSAASGFLGVAVTDFIQFIVAMIGAIALAVFVLNSAEIGGLSGLKAQLTAVSPESLQFLPSLESASAGSSVKAFSITALSFFAYAGVQWWASWYPGAEPGGGGYVVQRMLSAKNEKHAVFATLFFQVAHYCIRPWPWILVALSALVLYSLDARVSENSIAFPILEEVRTYEGFEDAMIFDMERLNASQALDPNQKANILNLRQQLLIGGLNNVSAKEMNAISDFTRDTRKGYIMAMKRFLPPGWKGLLLAAFFAAYMSTISTQLNWGASYLVNDLYKRFIRPGPDDDRHYVTIGRAATLLLMLAGLAVTQLMDSVSGVWSFLLECGAGLGLVLMLRWFWWRISAWTEITAMIAPIIGYSLGRYLLGFEFPEGFLFTVAFTSFCWLMVTFIAPATRTETLEAFYRKIKPGGNWKIFEGSDFYEEPAGMGWSVVSWISATVLVYALLFLFGKLLFAEWIPAAYLSVVVVASSSILLWSLRRTRIFS